MRALVCCGDGIGNLIQTTPLIRALISLGYKVDIFCCQAPDDALPLLRFDSAIGCISNNPGPGDFKEHYDVALRTWLVKLEGVSAARYLVGESPIKAGISEAEAAFQMAVTLGYEGEMPATQVAVPRQWIPLMPPDLALHAGGKLGGGWGVKRLMPSSYGVICEELLHDDPDLHIHVMGTEIDDMPAYFESDRLHDRRGRGSLVDQIGLISRCCAFLGNDAGLAHAATAVGTPTVVVFGPTSITKNLPPRNAVAVHRDGNLPCQPCQEKEKIPCYTECLAEIDLTSVVEAVKAALYAKTA